MTKRHDAEIVWVDEPLPRLVDGKIDWELMFHRTRPDEATIEWVNGQHSDVVHLAEMQVREFFEQHDPEHDPRLSSLVDRLRRRQRPATRADVEDLFEDLLEVMVLPRPQSSKLGRPEKPIKDTLRILAGRWVGHNGRPTVRARLEEYLSQVAEDHGEPLSKDTAQRLAQEAIDADRAHEPDIVD